MFNFSALQSVMENKDKQKGSRKVVKKDRKSVLCSELASAIRKLQEQHVRTKIVESGDVSGEQLCDILEAVFLHELKNKGQLWRVLNTNSLTPPEPSFWAFVDPLVSDEIKLQIYALRNSESDIKKCRSWVRLMLAKGLMLTFLQDLQRHPGLLAFHYGGDAVLRDPEQSEIITQLLKGLSLFQLEYNYTSTRLNTWDPPVLQLSGLWTPPETISIRQTYKGSERISPPSSSTDFEGAAVIDLAMHKYTKRRTSSNDFTDSQLIRNEVLQQLTPSTGGGSTSSISSAGSMDSDLPVGSYGAMLRSYARRSSAPKRHEVPAIARGEARHRMTVVDSSPQSESGREGGGEGGRRKEGGGGGGGEGGGGGGGGGEGKVEGEDSNLYLALSLNYEIVSSDGSVTSDEQKEAYKQSMMAMLTTLVTERGLDSQNYHCAGCRRPIGVIFGKAKLCKYNGQYYCFDCHLGDERVIPARVLFNWDFRKHKVCMASCEFLDSIEHEVVLNVQEVNKAIYMYIPELEEALKLRQQLKYLKDYLFTCKDQELVEQFKRRARSPHIYENEHLYSLHELIEVNSGALNDRLKKAVKIGKKHIRQCALCSQKGFICETCHSSNVIYPFDVEDTYQCPSCNALFHNDCQPTKGGCPKCVRIRRRRESLSEQDDYSA